MNENIIYTDLTKKNCLILQGPSPYFRSNDEVLRNGQVPCRKKSH